MEYIAGDNATGDTATEYAILSTDYRILMIVMIMIIVIILTIVIILII